MQPFISARVTLAMNLTNLTLGILSIILNLLLLYIFFRINNRERSRCLSHALIGIIATVDLMTGLFVASMCAISLVYGAFFEEAWFCNGLGMGIIFCTCLSSYLIGLLSAERYYRVRGYNGMSGAATTAMTAVVVTALAVTSFGTALNDGYQPDPTRVYCLPQGPGWPFAMFVVAKVVLTVPLPVLVVSYVSIFVHCSREIKRFPYLSKSLRMVLFLSVYCACFIPSTVLVWYDFFDTLHACPVIILVSAPVVLAALPVANPFLVMLLNQEMAAAFSQLLAEPTDSLPKDILVP